MSGLVLVTVIHTFPFVYLLAASALESVDASMEESAQILGAGSWRTATAVTLPLVAPAILSGALIAFVNAIALFGSQAIIGLPGRIFTLPTRIYALFDHPPEYGLASALSLSSWPSRWSRCSSSGVSRQASYVTLGGKGPPAAVALGPARWGVRLLRGGSSWWPCSRRTSRCWRLARKSWGLGFWQDLTLKNYRFILFEYDVTRRAIVNSLLLASAAATAAVLLGSLISWIDLRTTLPGRKLLDYASLIPLGLPGIVVAVALIQFWLRMPLPIYGTLVIILLAYTGRYVPLGVRSASAAFRQIDPRSRRRRGSPARVAQDGRSVTLPLARPGLFAGWILVFVPALQELSASILLSLGLDHARGRRLQPLRDRLSRGGGGAGRGHHAHHHRRHRPGHAPGPERRRRRASNGRELRPHGWNFARARRQAIRRAGGGRRRQPGDRRSGVRHAARPGGCGKPRSCG